jgi:hypothetical protein
VKPKRRHWRVREATESLSCLEGPPPEIGITDETIGFVEPTELLEHLPSE